MIELLLDGKPIVEPTQKRQRISMLLWGSSGSGKTTLAATAPGKKLWINFDPDGTESLLGRSDVLVLDLSNEKNSVVEKFREENPMRIEKLLTDNPEIETVVFDSLTTFGEKALHHGVKLAQSTNKGRSATLEDPGYSGFGNKNTWTRLVVNNLLQSTGRLGRHCIFIAHEDKPTTNDQGVVLFISIMLGSSLNEQVPIKISEVWHLSDNGKKHMISIRPCYNRKPMRTRMFKTTQGPQFEWHFDVDKWEGDTIAKWYEQWTATGGKIDVPK
ncbi:AAA family ATPase [bacterium]|nr:AAA family ATPase [bacterium]